jgi:hypothetical protein
MMILINEAVELICESTNDIDMICPMRFSTRGINNNEAGLRG